MHITVDTIIGDILRRETDAAAFFREAGMHCIECPAARGETVAEACAVHGMDAEQFAAAFNARRRKISKFADPAIRRNSWNKTE